MENQYKPERKVENRNSCSSYLIDHFNRKLTELATTSILLILYTNAEKIDRERLLHRT
jgi:hypothetical protein